MPSTHSNMSTLEPKPSNDVLQASNDVLQTEESARILAMDRLERENRNKEILDWNEKWWAIMESGKVDKKQLEDLGFCQNVVQAYLKKLPSVHDWEETIEKDYYGGGEY